MRAMFPVAESIGDLIYRTDGATAYNLRSVLEHEFERSRFRREGRIPVVATGIHMNCLSGR